MARVKDKPRITKREGAVMNKAAFADLREYLLSTLLQDDKIGRAPTIPSPVEPQPLKVKCLRCGFMFHGSPENRICTTCKNYNSGVA